MWVNDISWSVEIFISFFVASEDNMNFESISMAYLKSYFIFDALATFTPMIFLQKQRMVNMLKFLRFVHIYEMFDPILLLINCLMKKANEK